MGSETAIAKKAIRAAMRGQRRGLDAAWMASAGAAIAAHLTRLPAFQAAETVCLFASLDQEVPLDAVCAECREHGRRVLLPAFRPEERSYGFKAWRQDQPLQPGHWGVPEPAAADFETLCGTVFMVVPGLAFDASGGRIGYGAGYYDRLLQLSVAGGGSLTSAGVCFDFQVQPALPQEPWDRQVDFVVTERRAITCRRVM